MRVRPTFGLGALLASLAALGLFAPGASATQFQRPFLETFGSAEQPSFEVPESIAVDRTTDDVLVGVRSEGITAKTATFNRFNPDATPAPFGALGTNTIDGKKGPGELPCAVEPASCDETPQNGLSIGNAGYQADQIAFDPTNGNIYITQNAQNVVDIFSPEGKFLGQLTQAGTKFSQPCGVAVDSAGTVYIAQNNKISIFVPAANPPVNGDNKGNFTLKGIERPCRLALGSGPSAGKLFIASNGGDSQILKFDTVTGTSAVFTEGYESLVAVDPTSGNPIVYNRDATAENGFAELTEFDGSLEATNSPLSRLMVEEPSLTRVADYATDSVGKVYATYARLGAPPSSILVYAGPAVTPTVSVDPASDITSSGATLSGSVDPEGIAVTDCFFEYGPTGSGGFTIWEHTIPCEGSIPPDSNEHTVHATISGLAPDGVKYSFRLAARNENGTERSTRGSLLSGSSAETQPATVTGLSTATLNGVAHPEGSQYTECFFEWGLATNAGFEHAAPCTPSAAEIPPDSGAHPVSAALTGLQEATTYRFRLIAKNGAGIQTGPELTFETFGPPRIDAVRASNASQSTATIEAEINPRGFPASYRFEWGPTTGYGNVSPASFEPIGSGTSRVRVSAELSGLSPATRYHYRVVASGGAGTTQGADHELETLNACGLPDGRCFELVSPRDPGLVALPGEGRARFEPEFQAAEAPGSLAYEVELGFPGATSGGEIFYLGSRAANGWESAQYSPSLAGSGQGSGVRAVVLGLSSNLDCGVVASKLPLTADPVARVNIEAGGGNLYRRGPTGSYTLITNMPPEVPKRIGEASTEFQLIGMSADCSRVVFLTEHHYSGVQGEGTNWLYEWRAGTLHYVGSVPTSSGEAVAVAGPGSGNTLGSTYKAASRDASHVFFTATSKTGNDTGNNAVFVRIDGTKTLNVSQSPLAVDTGAVFQGATPDGSRVYFTANAGLTGDSSSEGRDLYECHIVAGPTGPECELTDLSVDHDPGGAEAGGSTGAGVIGALVGLADDGSRVYFIARGQLIPGRGSTFAENEAAGTFSLYVREVPSGAVRFVGSVSEDTVEIRKVSTGNFGNHTARVSADGRFLAFESSSNPTGNDSGGMPMVYLYDDGAASSAEALVCVSCRQDGKPSVYSSTVTDPHLDSVRDNRTYLSQSLVVRGGKPIVFFKTRDDLAPGGVEGEWGLYEWAHGQVFNIASDLPGATPPSGPGGTLSFMGASSDGTDLYFVDSAALNWENPEARRAAWDARIGGGFTQPTPVPGCNPTAEGSCQGAGPPAPSAPSAGSTTFNGPGNVKPKKQQKKKHHKKKHQKHHKKGQNNKKKKDQGKKSQRARHANTDWRAVE